jgi:hypothetical protein
MVRSRVGTKNIVGLWRAWTRAGDQTHSRRGLEVGRFLARGSAMLFESSYKRVQRACHDRSHGQATASRVIPQQSHRAKNKVGHQENWGQNARGVEDQTIRRLEETKQVYPLRDGKPMGLTAVTGQQAICCRADSIDVQAITFIDAMMSANESLQTV